MSNLIKSFQFESEGVILTINIRKEVYKNSLKMIIDGDVISNNPDLVKGYSTNFSSKDISVKYLDNSILWISSNEWKGLRWEKYSNETKYSIFNSVKEMKESYIAQREYVDLICSYFYDCIKNYKKLKLLYETQIDEIISEDEFN
ncbi:hypothetical protein [Flavobacterium pallidum]|uniref:Uncharacterized protein n=1 Tax=Flavobacterium pallidum TaxID=2172098 RepID=A0A2S1SKB8_9FLAO|nr:hypothetical protein [Flavobacterium pallidum]AWI26835.1 hypothetical protein HYN49_13520 [Flavobacterium pallidum]